MIRPRSGTSAAAISPATLAVLAAATRLEPRPARPALEALDAADVYKTYLDGWWAEHESWRAAFPPSSVLELQKLYAPNTPKVRGIPRPSREQQAAHAEAVAAHGEAHAAWKPVSVEREKAIRNVNRAVKRQKQACTSWLYARARARGALEWAWARARARAWV